MLPLNFRVRLAVKYRDAWIAHVKAINIKGSGTATSYIRALTFLDEILRRTALFGHQDFWSISSPDEINSLYLYALEHQKIASDVFQDSAYAPSYGRGGYYSAALKSYCQFMIAQQYQEQLWDIYQQSTLPPSDLAKKMNRKRVKSVAYLLEDGIDLKSRQGVDALRSVKTRLGQGFFREMILKQYRTSCCVTGLSVPEVLRASHISEWAKDEKNRLNPANGLCLSATYDAAFDKHLISFDEQYRMILSRSLKDHYNNDAFKAYFLNFEGKKLRKPDRYLPDQKLLDKHRSLMP
jgi:putative restriction endonuclease